MNKIVICTNFIGNKFFFGSGALSGKMLLLRIIENDKIDSYFRTDG